MTRRSIKMGRKRRAELGKAWEVIVPGCGPDVPRCRAPPTRLYRPFFSRASSGRPIGTAPTPTNRHVGMHCLTRRKREAGNLRVSIRGNWQTSLFELALVMIQGSAVAGFVARLSRSVIYDCAESRIKLSYARVG